VRFRDQIRLNRNWSQRGVVGGCSGADDLSVGAMQLGAADRHPVHDGAVGVGEVGERAAGQDVSADDSHLPFDSPFAGGSVRGEDVDIEAVVTEQRDCRRMQRYRMSRSDMFATMVFVRSQTIEPGTPPKCANARIWLPQNAAASIEWGSSVSGSRE
jgi:hypothetical protein